MVSLEFPDPDDPDAERRARAELEIDILERPGAGPAKVAQRDTTE